MRAWSATRMPAYLAAVVAAAEAHGATDDTVVADIAAGGALPDTAVRGGRPFVAVCRHPPKPDEMMRLWRAGAADAIWIGELSIGRLLGAVQQAALRPAGRRWRA